MQKVARKTGSSEKVAEQLVKSGLAAGPVTVTSFASAFIWEISARFPRLKKATEDPGDEFWRERDKANMAKCKNYNFRAYHSFGISFAVLYNAYDEENTAGNARRCHLDRRNSSRFHPGNWAKVFQNVVKFSALLPTSRLQKPRSWELRQPTLIWTHQKFYKGFRGKARSRKPDSCEEALSRICFRLPFGLGRLVSIWNLGEREFRFKVLRKTSLTYISLWTSLIAFQFSWTLLWTLVLINSEILVTTGMVGRTVLTNGRRP